MKCYFCDMELIWGGDHDLEDDEDHDMMTNLSCRLCKALVIVYKPRQKHWSESLPDTDIKIEEKELH